MGLQFGGRKIAGVFYGGRKIREAYLGNRLVYRANAGRDRGEWQISVKYEVGDIFHFEGRSFRVLREHTSNRFIEPGQARRLTTYMEEI